MDRKCPFCGGGLQWRSGVDEPGRERAGNARETDEFECAGCRRVFQHSVSERFSGNVEGWSVREGERWRALDQEQWPRLVAARDRMS